MTSVTDEQRKIIDDLAESISRLCHQVIRRRLEQLFDVIGDEVVKEQAILLDALNRQPDESLIEWEARARAVRTAVRDRVNS